MNEYRVLRDEADLNFKRQLRTAILDMLESAEEQGVNIYINTVYAAAEIKCVCKDRSFINDVVTELRDEGIIEFDNWFSVIRLTEKRLGRW
jgi:hypothetical protein